MVYCFLIQFFARSKMKYSSDICSETRKSQTKQWSSADIQLYNRNPGSQISLFIWLHFIPDTADKLYKIQVLEKLFEETKVRNIGWGRNYDSWINSKSIWSYWCFKKPFKLIRPSGRSAN